jgi:hypothetical protein
MSMRGVWERGPGGRLIMRPDPRDRDGYDGGDGGGRGRDPKPRGSEGGGAGGYGGGGGYGSDRDGAGGGDGGVFSRSRSRSRSRPRARYPGYRYGELDTRSRDGAGGPSVLYADDRGGVRGRAPAPARGGPPGSGVGGVAGAAMELNARPAAPAVPAALGFGVAPAAGRAAMDLNVLPAAPIFGGVALAAPPPAPPRGIVLDEPEGELAGVGAPPFPAERGGRGIGRGGRGRGGFARGGLVAAAPLVPFAWGGAPVGLAPAAPVEPAVNPGGVVFVVQDPAAVPDAEIVVAGPAAAPAAGPPPPPPYTVDAGPPGHPHYIFDFGHADNYDKEALLSFADNVHDAWGGFRNIKPAKGDEIRAAVVMAFRKKMGDPALPGVPGAGAQPLPVADPAGAASHFLHTTLGAVSVLLSNIEDSTVSWFEDNTTFLRRRAPNAETTYTAICNGNPIDMANTARNQHDAYYLKPGGAVNVESLNEGQKTGVQNFILQFLLGTVNADIYMTFDAAPKIIGKIFKGHSNVYGLITPQNIGDSATTSFKQLGANPDLYKFPKTQETGRFVSRRNFLTKSAGALQLSTYYENEGFDKKFPFKFRFGLTSGPPATAGVGPSAWTSYQNGYNQGPALDYLLGLMLEAQRTDVLPKYTRVVPATTCLQIATSIDNNPTIKNIVGRNAANEGVRGGIFLDLKREGDQDACDAALYVLLEFIKSGKYVILVTIDRLCSLLARLLGIPCILHYNDTITLYKNSNNDRNMTDEDKEAFLRDRTKKFVEQYKTLYDVYAAGEALRNLASFACSVKGAIDIEDAAAAVGKAEDPNLRPLLRNRLVDIFNHLKKFAMAWPNNGFGPLHALPAAPAAAPADPAAAAAYLVATARVLRANEITLKRFLDHFASQGFDTKMLLGMKDILAAPTRFSASGEYPLFNYSYKQYTNLVKPYNDVAFLKRSGRSRRAPINYDTLLNDEDGYNTLLSAYITTFFNSDAGSAASDALMFRSGTDADKELIFDYELTAAIAKETAGKLEAQKRAEKDRLNAALIVAMPASERIRVALKRNIDDAPAVDRRLAISEEDAIVCQGGGAYVVDNIPKAMEILQEICSKASQFTNRELGRVYPGLVFKHAMRQLANALRLPPDTGHNRLLKLEAYAYAKQFTMAGTPRISYRGIEREVGTFLDTIVGQRIMIVYAKIDDVDLTWVVREGAKSRVDNPANIGDEEIGAAIAIEAWIPVLDAWDAAKANPQININTDKLVRTLSTAEADTFLLKLLKDWQSAPTGFFDTTYNNITALLEPYFAFGGFVDAPALRFTHPLTLPTIYPRYQEKVAADAAATGHNDIDRPVVYSLLTLTFLDDIFNGNVRDNTSLVTSILGALPAYFRDGFIVDTVVQWEKLGNLIRDTIILVNGGVLAHEVLRLYAGGARKTRRSGRRRAARRTRRAKRV